MTNQTACFDTVSEIIENSFEVANKSGSVAEAISTAVDTYFSKVLPGVAGSESQATKLIQIVKGETTRYAYADLGDKPKGEDLVSHVITLNKEVIEELQKEVNNSILNALEEEANLHVLYAVFTSLSLEDKTSDTFKLVVDNYITGLEIIDDAGELSEDQEVEALNKLNEAYNEALVHIRNGNFNNAVALIQNATDEVQEDLDF